MNGKAARWVRKKAAESNTPIKKVKRAYRALNHTARGLIKQTS